jgi:hypothetical protein
VSDQPLTPAEQVRRLYEEAETRAASAAETLVSSEAFSEVLSIVTGNTMAVTKMAVDGLDQLVRNLRLAGRADMARLGRQLARTEDKLEQVLQMVEQLEERVTPSGGPGTPKVEAAEPSRPRREVRVPATARKEAAARAAGEAPAKRPTRRPTTPRKRAT